MSRALNPNPFVQHGIVFIGGLPRPHVEQPLRLCGQALGIRTLVEDNGPLDAHARPEPQGNRSRARRAECRHRRRLTPPRKPREPHRHPQVGRRVDGAKRRLQVFPAAPIHALATSRDAAPKSFSSNDDVPVDFGDPEQIRRFGHDGLQQRPDTLGRHGLRAREQDPCGWRFLPFRGLDSRYELRLGHETSIRHPVLQRRGLGAESFEK
jgi:hypothetical protein